MPDTYSETYSTDYSGQPVLQRLYDDGSNAPVELRGERAIANSNTDLGDRWRRNHDALTVGQMLYNHGATKEDSMYQYGQALQRYADSPTGQNLFSRAMNQGPFAGGILGAGAGALGGLLAGAAKKSITGEGSPAKWAIIASLLGLAGGAFLGNARQKTVDGAQARALEAIRAKAAEDDWNYDHGVYDETGLLNKSSSVKQAAMFHDPKNVILEKLQGATDIGFAEKAKLVAAVRNLDHGAAQQLAEMVRATLGFGVGALIAKFIFGAGGSGMLFGGLAGVLGSSIIQRMQQRSGVDFLNTPHQATYADFLQ